MGNIEDERSVAARGEKRILGFGVERVGGVEAGVGPGLDSFPAWCAQILREKKEARVHRLNRARA